MEQVPEAVLVKNSEISILPYGTKVKVGGSIPGTITSTCISNKHVTYEVAYWAGLGRHAVWLTEGEVELAGEPIIRQRIGFKK